MRTYDGRGNLVSKAKLIEEAGFVVGSYVVRKADETEAKIEGFEGDNVIITISDGLLSGRCKVHVRNYTTVDPKQFVFFKIETRACDVQSWETNVKDCKAETDTAVQSGRTHLKKEVRSPNSKPFGELFFKREHDAGHAAQSAGS